ncbi:phosphoserine aminotransferase [Lewinella marina]|uniref:Phosphoserine aminotransferase n=1 Tax=Neolewinella marina TaxID=438751 RepID=A0A2G0CF83_9BACT|nr:3-phosphoserine/phosphohydroxythreonine transaminase [Neolewinella marina]NJB85695.1 phosphoserine aminotransferase [Neolewinella marina]PHK98625.1 3-phosphoserine/phosphohydroxythreonine aminotransferase [Neolewinella marina]
MKKINFSAGPAILPASVLKQASAAVENLDGSGLSILEISHRSDAFDAVLLEAEQLVRELLNVGDDYGVLFLSGGASSQFFMTAMNLLNPEETAGYLDTGSWSAKAIKEAKHFGKVNVIASSKESNYNHIPREYTIPEGLKYVHLTSNNTIFGTQFKEWPETDLPLVADMSSDILSRRIPLEKFGIIYAGAQKNLGPAGATLVIVRKDLLGKVQRNLPSMLDYRVHIDGGSTFNTPPVYPIYVMMLTLRWIKEQGGLEGMEKLNERKAKLLYDEIDRNPKFRGTVADEQSRSLMNVTFVCTDEADTDAFLAAAEAAGCDGITGHRSVGGFRASIYNSMPYEGVETLVRVMREFE